MRIPALLALVALLSGCTGSSDGGTDGPDPPTDNGGTDGNATAPGTPTEPSEVAYAESEWGSLEAVAVDINFQVEVPEGGKNASVVIEADQAAFESLTANLEGCGEATQDTPAVAPQGLRFSMKLCDDPEPGQHEITVEVVGTFSGVVRVVGLSPV